MPDNPEYWASTLGRIARVDPGGDFDVLRPWTNQFGEPYLRFKRPGGGHKKVRLVAAMVLDAHGRSRTPGCRVWYRDGNVENCKLENLSWGKGQAPVGDLKPRKCLGHHCGYATFMSSGEGNRLCPVCARVNESRGDAEGIHVPGEFPDAPSLAQPATKRG